jgi:hypothetical protein
MIGAALLAVAGLSVPAGATAAAESCGATGQQWVGSFQGTVEWYYTKSLELEVDQNLRVLTTKMTYAHPLAAGTLIGGKLHWATYNFEMAPPFGPVRHDDDFTTTSVTCAGGKVTAFSGTLHIENAAYGASDATFSVS